MAQWTGVRHAPAVLVPCVAAGDCPRGGGRRPAARIAAGAGFRGDASRFTAFLEELKTEATARGISSEVSARALDGLTLLPVMRVERDRGQAEAVLSIDGYVGARLTASMVRRAREMAAEHRPVLEKVGKATATSRAIWSRSGPEVELRPFTGVRPTVQALATLAFDGRRGTLFRNELFDALRIVTRTACSTA